MQRLAGVRIWSYIAARGDWVRDAAHWQAKAREVEDLVSDALHERLTARFVDRRAAHLMRRLEEQDGAELLSAVTGRGEVVVEGHPVGHIAGFGFIPDPLAAGDEKRLVLRAARRSLREEMPRRVARLEAAPDAGFTLDDAHRVPLGRRAGRPPAARPDAAAPRRAGAGQRIPRRRAARAHPRSGCSAGSRRRSRRNSRRCWRPRRAPRRRRSCAGALHRLVEAGGVVPGATEAEVPPALRARLKPLGVRAGRFALAVPAVLKPRATALRARLWAIRNRVERPALPAPGLVSIPPQPAWPPGFAAAMGWVEAGPILLRLDIAERIAAELSHATRGGPVPVPGEPRLPPLHQPGGAARHPARARGPPASRPRPSRPANTARPPRRASPRSAAARPTASPAPRPPTPRAPSPPSPR